MRRWLLPQPPVTYEQLVADVARLYPDPTALISAYVVADRGAVPGELLAAMGADFMFAVPTARLADAVAADPSVIWRYEFTWCPSR
jgi:para-nitrobenzyl esterase